MKQRFLKAHINSIMFCLLRSKGKTLVKNRLRTTRMVDGVMVTFSQRL